MCVCVCETEHVCVGVAAFPSCDALSTRLLRQYRLRETDKDYCAVTDLLSWTEEDTRVHPQAAVLGAPLEAGKHLYPELQETYMHR